MTEWRKPDKSRRCGIAVYNFKAEKSPFLSLTVGESIQILEETEGWYYGYATKNKSELGIFPKTYVHIKESHILFVKSHEVVESKELPLCQEIVSVLREWHSIWKQLFVEMSTQFHVVQNMMQELMDWKRKIMSHKLTSDELKDMQQKISSKIDLGNALLGQDMVIRDESGNVVEPEHTSIIQLFQHHEHAADRIKKEQQNKGHSDNSQLHSPHTFNLYVQLLNFVVRINEDADVLMNLYDAKSGKFISENYVIHNPGSGGIYRDVDGRNNFRVVFTDLGAKDRQRERVFLVFQIVRIGVMDPKDIDDKKQTKGLRRPFGVAAIDITDYMKEKKELNGDTQHFVPFLQAGEKEFMENVVKKIVQAKEINHKGQGLWVSMNILPGDIRQVKEEYPHLLGQNPPISRKMGFPEVILPGDVRNDIYVTIRSGEFTRGPTKTADKNVEVTMLVCNKQNTKLPNVISYGCGGEPMSEYKSIIYYHEDKPKWHETIKVAISTEEEFKGLHLKFLFKHKSTSENKDKSEKPFAMSFIKLMNKNGTTVADTDHNLLVYKIEKKFEDSDPYLDLPSMRSDLEESDIHKGSKITLFSGPFYLNQKDSFQINTYVCSTKLTHNVDLLGLLKWQEALNDMASLKVHLDKLMQEDGEEIVKFLQDLLDSLFNILMQSSISDSYDNLVFEALVHIVGFISDRKYNQFTPVLDAYVMKSFSFALAYEKLMQILKDYVDRSKEVNQKVLKKAMKSLEYLFKFIVQSRRHFALLNDGRGKQSFEMGMRNLIQSLCGMMLYNCDTDIKLAQGSALKFMCTTIPDIIEVFDAVEMSQLMVKFINNVPKERLTIMKLKCINDLVLSVIFKRPDCRKILLPMVLKHCTEHLSNSKQDEKEKGDSIQVLSDVMDLMFDPETGPHEDDMDLIIEESLRMIIQTTVLQEKTSKEATKCVALLMSVLRQMTEDHYKRYIDRFTFPCDQRDFLLEIMTLFRNLVQDSVFPPDWLEMIMLQNSIMLRSLRFFAHTIFEKFSTDFEEDLWSTFFCCAISYLTQKPLQLEQFSIAKRNKIVKKYNDMRREMGFEIRQMWKNLGENKMRFIPALVGPILEMTLIPEQELRKAAIPIFFDMMQTEFKQVDSYSRKLNGNFSLVENEIVMKLDALIEGGYGDEEYKELLCNILRQKCNDNKEMKDLGLKFVDMIEILLQRLLEYRKIIQYESKQHRMSCIVNLLNYYHKIGRQEMYIRYLYKLCDLHIECDNYTEAAFTLLLYVDLLKWSDEAVPTILLSQWHQEASTQRQLKELLYYDIISYFDKGKMWEKGINLCKELINLYENELFDYDRLSLIMKRQADLYSYIIKELRPDPEYFRVGYYGRGFPAFLQNKEFIYRGKEYERLSDFNGRMLSLFPNAELLRSLSPPSEDIKESDKQYLQINFVNPVMKTQERFVGKQVPEKILKYHQVNEVKTFTFDRRTDENTSDISKMWLERTTLTCSYELPGILCWFPVEKSEVYRVSPLECAIETLEASNKRINQQIEHHLFDEGLSCQTLTMVLNGIVDASVNGGIANYKMFYQDDYQGESENDHQLVKKLKELTRNQLTLLREGLNIHEKKVSEDMKQLHIHMEQMFRKMVDMIRQEYNIKSDPAPSKMKRYQSMSAVSFSRVSEAFNSMSSETNIAINQRRDNTSAALRTPSILVKSDRISGSSPSPVKGLQKVSNLSFFKRSSIAASSDHSSEDGNSNRNSLEANTIILSEQETLAPLTPKRPLRPDNSDKRNSRTSSSHQLSSLNISMNSLASATSAENVSDAESFEDPPPVPNKNNADSFEINGGHVPIRNPSLPNLHENRKSKPLPPPPDVATDIVPPPVPKKNASRSHPIL